MRALVLCSAALPPKAGALRGRIREADGHALADRRRRFLNRLKKDVGVVRVEPAFELAAARVHTLGHFALADAFLPR